jgi:hypothetical protein
LTKLANSTREKSWSNWLNMLQNALMNGGPPGECFGFSSPPNCQKSGPSFNPFVAYQPSQRKSLIWTGVITIIEWN